MLHSPNTADDKMCFGWYERRWGNGKHGLVGKKMIGQK